MNADSIVPAGTDLKADAVSQSSPSIESDLVKQWQN
jgi:hypothetical protein